METDFDLVRALEAERWTGWPGPPPVEPEPADVKRGRLLRLDRTLHGHVTRTEAS